eukprot:365119-Chlamydomonas_euryale.AAC.2
MEMAMAQPIVACMRVRRRSGHRAILPCATKRPPQARQHAACQAWHAACCSVTSGGAGAKAWVRAARGMQCGAQCTVRCVQSTDGCASSV